MALSEPLTNEPILPIPAVKITSPNIVKLGEKLFHDARFSSDQTVSCASCHLVSKGGADGRKVSIGVEGHKGTINTPSVFNSSLNFRQFWDGRAKSLSDQVEGPIHSSNEMNTNWQRIIKIINQDESYIKLFEENHADGVIIENIKQAIVAFEETLLTPNSRFDQYLRGDSSVLSNDEKLGYKLFKEYGCASCHQGVGVGGNMYQKLGAVFDYPFQAEANADRHLGRFNVTGEENDRHVFKVPSLRNVAKTAPYLHDGSKLSLADVVETMMVYQLGVPLSPGDVQLIVSFLETLTGEYQGKGL